VTPEEITELVYLRRARDRIDRDYALPIDVPAMARSALMSPSHFSRRFRAAYGETPYAYLMTRRIERAKALLRQGHTVSYTCVAVGATSLGSFSSRFAEIVGMAPSQYRACDHGDLAEFPPCVSRLATRPRRSPSRLWSAPDVMRFGQGGDVGSSPEIERRRREFEGPQLGSRAGQAN
jgi:AraC-like DNA-binding protein